MAEFRKCFHAIDVKNTGKITMEDLREYMKRMNYTEKFVTSWMKLFPMTEGGVITYEQYCETLGLIPRKHETEVVEKPKEMSPSIRKDEIPSVAKEESPSLQTIGKQGSLKEQAGLSPSHSKGAEYFPTISSAPEDAVKQHLVQPESYEMMLDQSSTQEGLYPELLIPKFSPIDMQVDTELKLSRQNLEVELTDLSSPIDIPVVEPVIVPPFIADLAPTEAFSQAHGKISDIGEPVHSSHVIQEAVELTETESKVSEPMDIEPITSQDDSRLIEFDLDSAGFREPPAKHRMRGHKREHREVGVEKELSENEQIERSIQTDHEVMKREKRKPRRGKRISESAKEVDEPGLEERPVIERVTKEEESANVFTENVVYKSLSPGKTKAERKGRKRSGSTTKGAQASKQDDLPMEQSLGPQSGEPIFGDHIFLKDPATCSTEAGTRTKGKKPKGKGSKHQTTGELTEPTVAISHPEESLDAAEDIFFEQYPTETEALPLAQQYALLQAPFEDSNPPLRAENAPLRPIDLEELEDTVEEHFDWVRDSQLTPLDPILLQVAENQQFHALETHSTEVANGQQESRKPRLKAVYKTADLSPSFRDVKSIRLTAQPKIYSSAMPSTTKEEGTKDAQQDKLTNEALSSFNKGKVGSIKGTQLRQPKRLPEPPLLPKPKLKTIDSPAVAHESGKSEKSVKHKLKEDSHGLVSEKKKKTAKEQHRHTEEDYHIKQTGRIHEPKRPKRIIQLARLRRRREAKALKETKEGIKEQRQSRFPRSFTVQPDPDLFKKRDKQCQRKRDRLMERRLKDRFQTSDQTSQKKKKKKLPTLLQRWRLRPSLRGRGMIVILLAGLHRGKRVVCLGRHKSTGLLLITGPFRYNGCPLRRVHPNMVIVTKTRINLGKFKLPARVHTREYFARTRVKKRDPLSDSNLLPEPSENHSAYKPNEARKEDQLVIDNAVCEAIKAREDAQMLIKYLKALFSLGKHDRPHKMVF